MLLLSSCYTKNPSFYIFKKTFILVCNVFGSQKHTCINSLFLSYNQNFRNQSLKLKFENRILRESTTWETRENVREGEVSEKVQTIHQSPPPPSTPPFFSRKKRSSCKPHKKLQIFFEPGHQFPHKH